MARLSVGRGLTAPEHKLSPHQSRWKVETDHGEVLVILDSQPKSREDAMPLIDKKLSVGDYRSYEPTFWERLMNPWTLVVAVGIPGAVYGAAVWVWRGFASKPGIEGEDRSEN